MPSSSLRSMAASRAGTVPSGITWMPSPPQPCWRDNSRVNQSVSEPSVVTPMRLPLRSATVLIDERDEHGQGEIGGRPIHGGDADCRHALGAETEARARANRDIDGTGGERLLHLRIAAEGGDGKLETFLVPDLVASISISAVLKANELGTDLPNRILSAAEARLPDIITSGVASAPPTTPRREILRIKILPDGAAGIS